MEAVEHAIRPNTRLLYLESPGNPAMHVLDLPALASLAQERGLATIIDNSMATPYNQRPLEHGIDLVVHSMSKYLSGHSDVVAGAVIGPSDRIRQITSTEMRELGGGLPPFESWLVLRGLRTLGLRMKAHNEAGLTVARWLEARPEVRRVLYAGLESHLRHDLAARQMRGFSGMVSVVLEGGTVAAIRFVDRLQLFGIAVSWGGFESLALPIDPDGTAFAAELGIEPGFVRLSIGLEDVDDLLCDLQQALEGLDHD
jgi:cystathionine gamma-lyase